MRLFIWALILLPTLFNAAIASNRQQPSSVVFYYNTIDSVRELMNYDRAVVTPALITQRQIDTLHDAGTQVFAYLSVGEYDGKNLPVQLQDASPVRNNNWQSHVMDLSSDAWQAHLLAFAGEHLAKGFDGLFLDTLDSYYLFAKSETTQATQQQALIRIIDALSKLEGNPKLILNRGFEVLEQLNAPIQAVVAESLYHSYHPLDNSYHDVSKTDTEWLSKQLAQVKSLGLEAIVIDYIPGQDRDAQKAAAKRLLAEGYTPYISDGMLYEFGVSTIVPVAKRVLGVFDGTETSYNRSLCHRMIAMPLEYNGYVPDCRDINTVNFERLDSNRYAGIVVWLEESTYNKHPRFQQWLAQQLHQQPLLFLKSLPTLASLRAKLGLRESGEFNPRVQITQGQDWLTSHYPLRFSQFETYPKWVSTQPAVQPLIEATDGTTTPAGLLFKAPWGGAALLPLPVTVLANQKEAWYIDPFRLIDETLNLPPIPAADVTTETGRRILTSHVDGDGFPSIAWFPGKPYTAEVLMEHVFKPYAIPQTVSVIEGEISKDGLYPKISAELEAIARQIFALPNVEIASHTFSHPFFWDNSVSVEEKQYGDHLPIPGYNVDYRKEIIGSLDYINQKLAPKGKKAKLILWSGRADPDEKTLAIAEQANVLNVNGGNTYVVQGNQSLTQVSPTIAWYPSAVHVYAPVLNENLYTNLWTENFDGYRRAIETFQLLGSPRRLKSISIYYHMYSGAYPASLKGLTEVYDWAIEQKATPLYLSEYAKRAQALYETGLAQTLNGRWLITSSGVRSIRLPHALGTPVMQQSSIAGWEHGEDGKYLILSQPRSTLTLSTTGDTAIRLKNANGQLIQWQRKGDVIHWTLKTHIPLKLELANASACQRNTEAALQETQADNLIRYTSQQAGQFSGELRCPSITHTN
ncbi:endo alpha-1,4 polygalactosaminidase [Photobacterium atrarenae]|uniref:Endo alpha-1,4 polygalactosaminidase n=1 Tax=Photobacterium atrarenae TaxID=865757 RepID=A0ABY5GLQ9_9GAMM|nr:endo alpha-1,4 polygalactosaminidase [Photobacterium atrarenae]UTV30076.1 endo alpha-1,4 polygalactosaminidase [Photobacterium atrarenae]